MGALGGRTVDECDDRIADAFVERFVVEPTADGPLRGTSFAAKDLFDIAGRPTACGNPTWRATHPAARVNAGVINLLLAAGARLLGKTRTDELAYSLEGRNFHEGAVRNPAAAERLTGGSSSGSAAAVAAGDVDFAIASDTAGSARVPAAWCGLAGIRPTHARIDVAGLAPLAPSFDTVGWMARSTSLMRRIGAVVFADAAPPLASSDSTATVIVHAPELKFSFAPVVAPAPGFKFNSAPRFNPAVTLVHDSDVDSRAGPREPAALAQIFSHCANVGLSVTDLSLGLDLERAAECLRVLQAGEAWQTHGQWIDAFQPRFGTAIATRFAAARAIAADPVQLRQAARDRADIIARLEEVLPPGHILCLPTVPGPAPRRDAGAAQLQLMRTQLLPLTALSSLTGRPQVTLPLLRIDAAPVGFSLLGWRNGDEALLAIAELLSSS